MVGIGTTRQRSNGTGMDLPLHVVQVFAAVDQTQDFATVRAVVIFISRRPIRLSGRPLKTAAVVAPAGGSHDHVAADCDCAALRRCARKMWGLAQQDGDGR